MTARAGATRPLARLAGFAAVAIASAVVPLLSVPALTASYGADGWAAVATGMSVGAAAAVVIELGYGLTGPQMVAREGPRARAATLVLSAWTRAMLFVPAAAVASGVAAAVAPHHGGAAALMAAAAAAQGMATVWFYTGTGRPHLILACDIAPRVVAAGASALLLTHGAPLIVHPALLLGASLVAVCVGVTVAVRGTGVRRRIRPRRCLRVLRIQSRVTTGRLASSVYIALPTAMVATVAPLATATFASVERVQRLVLAGLAILPGAAQSWVGSAQDRRERTRRAWRATGVLVLTGGVAAAALVFAMDAITLLLFQGTVEVDRSLALLSAAVIVLTSASRGVGGLVLVAMQRPHKVADAALGGSAVGVVAIPVAARALGAAGGLIGEVAAELATLTSLCVAALRRGDNRAADRRRERSAALHG
ncbi:hypothetical protein ACFUMH_02825 [Cellulomonas sp. NPDC057328]|uniref:hypothetical protein n=1 Tax=Cellulomonas sp. NPDC057328 TaxID=3346101 RepID=UPI0036252422